jgi:hypothetical protein
MKTVKVKVFVGTQISPRDFRLEWAERTDMAFSTKGDCASDRRRNARKIQLQRCGDRYKVVGVNTSADGDEHVRIYLRPAAEMVQMAKEPGWVPVGPPRQQARLKRQKR